MSPPMAPVRMAYLPVVIEPSSAFGTPLKGDTLFGHLCWAIANRYGEARLVNLLGGYTEGRPFAVVSDAFPSGYWPRPDLPPRILGAVDPTERKASKKRAWLPHSGFAAPIDSWLHRMVEAPECAEDGEGSEPERPRESSRFVNHETRFRNAIDRGTGTTGSGFDPYASDEFRYRLGTRLECHILHDAERLNADILLAAMSDIGALGYGRDANVGLGRFEVLDAGTNGPQAALPEQDGANAWLTLAPVAPQGLGLSPERSWYRPTTRFGRHGDRAVSLGKPFKAPILLADTGAVLSPAGGRFDAPPVVGPGPRRGGRPDLPRPSGNRAPGLRARARHPCAGSREGRQDEPEMITTFLSSFRLDVTTLGPLHIGTGAEMDPTSYVLDAESDALFEFPPDALATVLDERDRRTLLDLAGGSTDRYTIPCIQKLIHDRRTALAAYAARAVRTPAGVTTLYEERIGDIAQRETGAVNQLEIEKTFTDSVIGAPYLPGSSLKGAIRTALLNRINAGRKLTGEERSSAGRAERFGKLQQRLFRYRDFTADPMRLVHLADATWTGEERNGGVATETAIAFAVNRRKRRIVKDGVEVRSQAERKGLYQLLEVVPALRWRGFRAQLTLHGVGIEPEDLRAPAWPEVRWTPSEIAEACNAFYLRDFDEETETLRERGFLDERWYRAITKLMDGELRDLLASNRAFFLRVGRHSGAESLTLDGVRDIRIRTPQDQADRWEEEATTWWLASDRIDASSGLLPFGWVLVEMTEGVEGSAPRSETAELVESFHAESGEREWRAKVEQRRLALRREQEAAASQRAEADRRRHEQEAAEREREANRAGMTDDEREIDDLRTLFAKAQQPGAPPQTQGGELAGRANQILGAAKEWPEAPRLQAADLVEEIFRTIGFPKGKKGRERRQRISDLREGA